MEIYKTAVKNEVRVMVCHVLRYSPFYRTIKELVMNGEIGDIHSMVTEENVSYHHFATAFVRGKWANSEKCGSHILMSKCCHDLDIITWLKSGTPPLQVSSFGSLFNFKRENAPEGSGEKCVLGCRISKNCEFDAKKMYVDQELYGFYTREHLDDFPDRDEPGRLEKSLREGNPYGRCVWRCDNNVPDHQTVMIEFDDGSTASHNLIGGTAKPSRTIHIAGTRGEIDGCMEDGTIRLRKPDLAEKGQHVEKTIRLSDAGDGHGGGDMGLMEDFVKYMKNGKSSISTTELADSIYGHLIGFNAQEALEKRTVVQIERL
jgi:predicted dehydrogenase